MIDLTYLAILEVIFEDAAEGDQMLFEKFGFTDELEGQVAVPEHQELASLVTDKCIPLLALNHVEHLVHDSSLDDQVSQVSFQVQNRVPFIDQDHVVPF